MHPAIDDDAIKLIDYDTPSLGTKSELRAATDFPSMAMAMAIGGFHLGIHTDRYARGVLNLLEAAVAPGGSNEAIRQRIRDALGFMRNEHEKGRSF